MTRDEIREVAGVIGDDRKYAHFVNRINKEFDLSDEDRNSQVYVLFVSEDERVDIDPGSDLPAQAGSGMTSAGGRVGFAVLGHSPAKMRLWEKVFKDEGWVDSNDFTIPHDTCFELMYMYVRPECRRMGFGDQLFQKIMDFSKTHGAYEMYAYVSDYGNHALDFYKAKHAHVIQDLSDEDTTAAFLKWKID